ncbi:MAG TPA: hypothetical protein VLF68_00250 [Candidatus Saccharimonadales bacterium]|nr:hypothetical protein [Candidatus Saccharimonadales bacterium]
MKRFLISIFFICFALSSRSVFAQQPPPADNIFLCGTGAINCSGTNVTTTPPPDNTHVMLSINLALQGIGNFGSNPSPILTKGNLNPLHPTRDAAIHLFSPAGVPIATLSGKVTFDSASKTFKGNIDLGNFYPPTSGATTSFIASDFATGFVTSDTPPRGPAGIVADNANLYVANVNTGDLFRFPLSAGPAAADSAHKIGTIALPGSTNIVPLGLAFSKSGKLYAGGQNLNSKPGIVEISPTDAHVIRTVVTLPASITDNGGKNGVNGLAIDPISGDLFFAAPNGVHRVSHLEDGGTPTDSIYAIYSADGIYFAPDGTLYTNTGYFISGTNQAQPSTGRPIGPAGVTGPTDGIAVIADFTGHANQIFYNRNDGIITKYDLTQTDANGNHPSQDVITGGSRGDFVTVGPDRCLYATQSDKIIKVTNADANHTCSFAPTAPGLPSGNYIIKIKTDRYLRKLVPGVQNLTAGQTVALPQLLMTVGDVNGDNILNILDYNILSDCFDTNHLMTDLSSRYVSPSCSAHHESPNADLNDDGIIDGVDYNFFVSNLPQPNGD